ncbi:MAG: DNA polymerase III subunit delta [Melioribacteraceae bacterium]|nr:DNA polymerase III subunit delta [Melioribacteraceae bacterium]
MPKSQSIPSIFDALKTLTKDKLLSVYLLSGDDDFLISETASKITDFAETLIESDFDKESFSIEKNDNFNSILDLAIAFPFGNGKKVITVKNFEKVSDKKLLSEYISNPAEFTCLILINYGKISAPLKEPFIELASKGFLFETPKKDTRGLVSWILHRSGELDFKISEENALLVAEIVGEEKGLIDMQLRKYSDYIGRGGSIDAEIINKLTSSTKEYTVFNLQDQIAAGNKSKALEIGYNLLEGSYEIVQIITIITKFISTVAQIHELAPLHSNDFTAAKIANVSPYYYINCKKGIRVFNHRRLMKSVKALLAADLMVKTTSSDPKTIITILLSEILS